MSKTVLYMAISSDGFIAGPHDETPWSDEAWESLQAFVQSCDYVLLGRRTYEIMSQQDEFAAGPTYVVATDDPSFDAGDLPTLSIKSAKDMPDAEVIGVIGGGGLNGRLAKLGLINEMILTIEPIKLGGGIKLFGKYDVPLKLELIGSNVLGTNTVQRHYKIVH
jgi:dihydrofolate reductase